MSSIKNENLIIFNTPSNLDLAAEFTELSRTQIPKVEYLLNQINYFNQSRGYQINIRDHASALSLRKDILIKIIKKLVTLNVIEQVGYAVAGEKSNSYKIVNPYTDDTSKKTFYDYNDYLFLRKLKADKFLAKSKDKSAYLKPSSTENAKLLDRISQLEDFILVNGLQVPDQPTAVIYKKEQISGTTIEDVLAQNDKLPEPVKPKVKKKTTIEDIIKVDVVHQSKDIIQPEALNQPIPVVKIIESPIQKPVIQDQPKIIVITEQDDDPKLKCFYGKSFYFKNFNSFNTLDELTKGLVASNFRTYFNLKYSGKITITERNADYNFYLDYQKKELTFISYSIINKAA